MIQHRTKQYSPTERRKNMSHIRTNTFHEWKNYNLNNIKNTFWTIDAIIIYNVDFTYLFQTSLSYHFARYKLGVFIRTNHTIGIVH